MKLRTLIENVNNRIEAQVSTFEFTAAEEEKLARFGEPLVQIGGTIGGTVYRPGAANSTVTITGTGDGAEGTPIISGGVIIGVTITDPGEDYTTASIAFAGTGSSAAGSARFGLVGLTIEVGGSGADYEADDLISLVSAVSGGVNAQVRVETVDGNGAVLTATIVQAGVFDAVPDNPLDGWVTSGAGTGFEATGIWGVVAVVMSNGGTGYDMTPTVVSLTRPTATRRLRADFPVKAIFDLADSVDSDAMARVWCDTIVARCLAAKNYLMSQTTSFEGETVITG